jgi:hypothetical protein
MLELVVGAVAALLVVAGAAVIAGPLVPRTWRALWAQVRHTRPLAVRGALPINQPTTTGEPALHPTTLRALTAAARTYSLLRANGQDRLALELRAAARRVRADEPKGLLALLSVLRSLREVALDDDGAEARYRKLVAELHGAVKDRSEQLELLHFS